MGHENRLSWESRVWKGRPIVSDQQSEVRGRCKVFRAVVYIRQNPVIQSKQVVGVRE